LPGGAGLHSKISDLVVKQQPSAFSRHEMPERCMIRSPKKQRAQGKPGVLRTRSLAWEMKKPHELKSLQVHQNNPAFPARWLYGTAYFVLSPVTKLFCHRRLQVKTCKLDASVGAPGPHDFAVRVSALCRARYLRPSTASRTSVRDDRDTPLREGTRRRGENR
jgi:hypothetical protein